MVEDHPSFSTVLKYYLSLNDCDITITIDGEDNIKKFKAEAINLYLSDVMMPKKDGFTLY